MTSYVVVDTENSGAIKNKAHPFDGENQLLLLGLRSGSRSDIYDIDYTGTPYGNRIPSIRDRLIGNVLVGFNIKYDLHWLRRYGILKDEDFRVATRNGGLEVWDCQLAEFLLQKQKESYPSLGETCLRHSLTLKGDIISQYLEKGLDTTDIPFAEFTEYLKGDLQSTNELYMVQKNLIVKAGLLELFKLQCQDLVILADMEWNGIRYDLEKSKSLAELSSNQESEIYQSLKEFVADAPINVNWNSNDHLSAIIYGGKIKYVVQEPTGLFKSGLRVGQVKYKNVEKTHEFPRLCTPPEGSELAKEGFYSTSEDVLKSIKDPGKAKPLIEGVLKLSAINKLRTTYYEGIPKKFGYYGWDDGIMHGQFNQCVAITGRISSSNPNLQNIPPEGKECLITRY